MWLSFLVFPTTITFWTRACPVSDAQNTYSLATSSLGVGKNQAACSELVVLYPASLFGSLVL